MRFRGRVNTSLRRVGDSGDGRGRGGGCCGVWFVVGNEGNVDRKRSRGRISPMTDFPAMDPNR